MTILDPATEDFKASAKQFLDRADAVILHEANGAPAWESISLKPVLDRLIFRIAPPPYLTPEIVEFVSNMAGVS